MLPPTPRSTLFPYTTLFRSTEHALFVNQPHGGNAGDAEFATEFVFPALAVEVLRPGHFFLRDKLLDRKSTRLNSSHTVISYAVFCLKKKKIYKYYIHSHMYK